MILFFFLLVFGMAGLTTNSTPVWPNAIVPFFINSNDFHLKQKQFILTSIMTIASKTCLKFFPLKERPGSDERVLFIENPNKINKCYLNFIIEKESYYLTAGKECIHTKEFDLILLEALGFTSNANRDVPSVLKHIDTTYKQLCGQRYQCKLNNTTALTRKKRDTNHTVSESNSKKRHKKKVRHKSNTRRLVKKAVKLLGLEKELDELTEIVMRTVSKAMNNARYKSCPKTLRINDQTDNWDMAMMNFEGNNFMGNIFQKVLKREDNDDEEKVEKEIEISKPTTSVTKQTTIVTKPITIVTKPITIVTRPTIYTSRPIETEEDYYIYYSSSSEETTSLSWWEKLTSPFG